MMLSNVREPVHFDIEQRLLKLNPKIMQPYFLEGMMMLSSVR